MNKTPKISALRVIPMKMKKAINIKKQIVAAQVTNSVEWDLILRREWGAKTRDKFFKKLL